MPARRLPLPIRKISRRFATSRCQRYATPPRIRRGHVGFVSHETSKIPLPRLLRVSMFAFGGSSKSPCFLLLPVSIGPASLCAAWLAAALASRRVRPQSATPSTLPTLSSQHPVTVVRRLSRHPEALSDACPPHSCPMLSPPPQRAQALPVLSPPASDSPTLPLRPLAVSRRRLSVFPDHSQLPLFHN